MNYPNLYTDRLMLRNMRSRDADRLMAMRNAPGQNKYIDRIPSISNVETEQFITNINKEWNVKKTHNWTICFKESDELIGSACLWNFNKERSVAEIGYELHPNYQKMGIMREAVKSILRYAFSEKLNLGKILAIVHKENIASIQLLITSGFVIDITMHDNENTKNLIYSLLNPNP